MEKQRWEESEKRREEERRSEKRKSQKKEDAGARKVRNVAIHCVFSMICGSGGSKSRLAKAAGAEPSGQMRDEKLHAVVAPSTFGSQNVQSTSASELLEVAMSKKCTLRHISQNTPCSDQFWKLTGRKSAAVVAAAGRKYGMELHYGKFQLLGVRCNPDIHLPDNTCIQTQQCMMYLGTMMTADGKHGNKLSRRIGIAKSYFAALQKVWKHSSLHYRQKVQIEQNCGWIKAPL